MSNFLPSRFESGSAALIVIDVQNDFCDPSGAIGQLGGNTSVVVDMIPRLQQFIDDARRAGVLVVFVRTTHDTKTNSPQWLSRRGDLAAGAPRPVETCATGSWGAEFYRVHPEDSEPVVTKHRYSAFAGTDLDLVLRTAGVKSLLFTGVSTNVCVESSLRDGSSHDYAVTLVDDCAASPDLQLHLNAIDNVERYFGVVANSSEISQTWSLPNVPR